MVFHHLLSLNLYGVFNKLNSRQILPESERIEPLSTCFLNNLFQSFVHTSWGRGVRLQCIQGSCVVWWHPCWLLTMHWPMEQSMTDHTKHRLPDEQNLGQMFRVLVEKLTLRKCKQSYLRIKLLFWSKNCQKMAYSWTNFKLKKKFKLCSTADRIVAIILVHKMIDYIPSQKSRFLNIWKILQISMKIVFLPP